MGKRNSEENAEKQKEVNKNFIRKGLVDGVPASYDFNYILKTKKSCDFCKVKFLEEDISENRIVYTDEFDFIHKECIETNQIGYTHSKFNDFSSPVVLQMLKNKINKNSI